MGRTCAGTDARIPSEEEFASFERGGHPVSGMWNRVSSSWRCPSCGRTKREIVRWKRGAGEGFWFFALHAHHDHGDGWSGTETVCSDCNAADGIAKRMLKLPENWSFSASEMSRFVVCATNGALEKIDLDTAFDIFIESLALDGAGVFEFEPDVEEARAENKNSEERAEERFPAERRRPECCTRE